MLRLWGLRRPSRPGHLLRLAGLVPSGVSRGVTAAAVVTRRRGRGSCQQLRRGLFVGEGAIWAGRGKTRV